ncbi:MAG TPA: CBS domain-containing protein [Bacteroidales bacterium]|jgi:Predicted signal-transduction protein containing cAMP-binding and CBS domains
MIKVKEILDGKGHSFFSVKPENTVFEALEKMAEKDVGAIMVIDNGKLVGVFSERDYARKIVLHGFASKNSKVGDFMTKELLYVHPDTSILDCMALMTNKRVRHLPVLENDKIEGVISIGDVVNFIIHQQNVTIKDLENYIYGGRM